MWTRNPCALHGKGFCVTVPSSHICLEIATKTPAFDAPFCGLRLKNVWYLLSSLMSQRCFVNSLPIFLALLLGFLRQRPDKPAPGKRHDAVRADAEPSHVERNRLGEPHDSHLGGRIIGLREIADDPRRRREVNEASMSLRLEVRCCRAR